MKNQNVKLSLLLILFFAFPVFTSNASTESSNDENITSWVEEALKMDPRVDSTKIKIKTHDGIVKLSGQVSNLSSKKYADLEAKKIGGVRGVINELFVSTPFVSDEDIGKNLKKRYKMTQDIDLQKIKVSVADGHVILSGEVGSRIQESEAELIASELNGVKKVSSQLKIRIQKKRSDENILKDVRNALSRDVYLNYILIDVHVKKGVVTLTGKVATAYQKERAKEDALFVENVNNVKNYVEVGKFPEVGVRKKPPVFTDDELKKNVRDELYMDLRIMDPYAIHVEAKKGNIVLEGTVSSFHQKNLASKDAQDVAGVIFVSNNLSVSTDKMDDEILSDNVQFALNSDSILCTLNILNRVNKGVVTLYGNVNNKYEKKHAVDVVSHLFGVKDVVNDITVKRVSQYSDSQIELLIKARLASNWETKDIADQIGVSSKDGIVTLTGNLNSWSEYKTVMDVTCFIDGVRDLKNKIKVVNMR